METMSRPGVPVVDRPAKAPDRNVLAQSLPDVENTATSGPQLLAVYNQSGGVMANSVWSRSASEHWLVGVSGCLRVR